MKLMSTDTLKNTVRIIIAAPLGYYTVKYFDISDTFLAILFYFGIYIAVSIAIEGLWRIFDKKKEEEKSEM